MRQIIFLTMTIIVFVIHQTLVNGCLIIKRRVSTRRIETHKRPVKRLRRLESAANCGVLGGDDKLVRNEGHPEGQKLSTHPVWCSVLGRPSRFLCF